jgi:ATP-dependent DNA helicase PIF1
LTFFDFLRHYDFSKMGRLRPRPRAAPRVLSYFPRYRPGEEDITQHEHFCRMKMMLHHPFQEVSDLLELYPDCRTFKDAYDQCRTYCNPHPPDFLEPLDAPDEDEFEAREESDVEDDADFGELARQHAGDQPGRLEDPELLGQRLQDREYDWSRHVGRYPSLDAEFWNRAKTDHPANLTVPLASQSLVDGLRVDQRKVCSRRFRLLFGQAPD